MEFTLKKMGTEHIEQIALLEKECFSEPWSKNALAEELSNENSYFLVAVSDEVMGYIGVQEICGEAYITNVAVFGKHRKLGIGRALLNAACDGAKGRGCEFITLEVRESNAPAIKLYEKFNFKVVGIRKKYYNNIDDAIIYTRNLN